MSTPFRSSEVPLCAHPESPRSHASLTGFTFKLRYSSSKNEKTCHCFDSHSFSTLPNVFEAVVAAADLRCQRICDIFAIFHCVWKIVDSPEALLSGRIRIRFCWILLRLRPLLQSWKDFVECFDVSIAFEIVTALVFSEANMLPMQKKFVPAAQ
jgi:hypothetical protein